MIEVSNYVQYNNMLFVGDKNYVKTKILYSTITDKMLIFYNNNQSCEFQSDEYPSFGI